MHSGLVFDDLEDINEAENGGTINATGSDDLFLFSGMNPEEVQFIKDQKDAVIFLVDCSASMFEPNQHNPDSTSSINQILKATLSFMKSKIINSDSDKVGIVLFNCSESNNPLNYKNISVMQSLDALDAQVIKEFQR